MKRFVPPTPQEATEYAQSIDFDLNGEQFCDYYAQMGWRLSNGQRIRDWQACVRTWKHRRTRSTKPVEAKTTAPTAGDLIARFEALREQRGTPYDK